MSEQPEISVVVPAYQEADSIYQALSRLYKVLDTRFQTFEIIVVTDGCTDDTAAVARSIGSINVKVIEYHPNKGKGFALKQGFKLSKAPLIAFCDGDLDIHPDSLPALIDILDLQHADAVVASKSHPNSEVQYPRLRRIQSYGFGLLVRLIFELPIRDTQTGLKVFKRQVLEDNLELVQSDGFAFDLELLARIAPNHKIIEGPVQIDFKFDSRVGVLEPIRMLRDMIKIKLRITAHLRNKN